MGLGEANAVWQAMIAASMCPRYRHVNRLQSSAFNFTGAQYQLRTTRGIPDLECSLVAPEHSDMLSFKDSLEGDHGPEIYWSLLRCKLTRLREFVGLFIFLIRTHKQVLAHTNPRDAAVFSTIGK